MAEPSAPASTRFAPASWQHLLRMPSDPVRISMGNLPFRGSLLWVPVSSTLSERLFAMLFGRGRAWRGGALAGS
jgi:hypothetical protein